MCNLNQFDCSVDILGHLFGQVTPTEEVEKAEKAQMFKTSCILNHSVHFALFTEPVPLGSFGQVLRGWSEGDLTVRKEGEDSLHFVMLNFLLPFAYGLMLSIASCIFHQTSSNCNVRT